MPALDDPKIHVKILPGGALLATPGSFLERCCLGAASSNGQTPVGAASSSPPTASLQRQSLVIKQPPEQKHAIPSYRACAEAFEKQNPDIKIKITQTGWFDYWTALSTAFVSGTAPDVFWDHLSRYPDFVENNLLEKIVGGYGVVFPAIPEAAEISMKRMAAKGADVSAFVEEAKQPDGTFFLPISEHASDVVRILRVNFDAIFLEGADVEKTLKAANKEVNALFE
jgi:ABC-type glycerol-3-phosphate transport system substrate-binding protein